MERLTTRSGFTNEVYLTGKADVCWADRPIEERAFCVGCHRHKGMDRTNCGALMLVDRLAAYEDTGLEPEEIREFAEDAIRQFAYHGQVNGRCVYTAGGLSTLEWAFQICGWDDPHPCPECECEIKNCHEWATGGRPTPDGYKFLCSRHYMAYEAREEAEAALATDC